MNPQQLRLGYIVYWVAPHVQIVTQLRNHLWREVTMSWILQQSYNNVLFIKLSVQKFQPLILIYRRDLCMVGKKKHFQKCWVGAFRTQQILLGKALIISVGNINTVESLQKNIKQIATRRNGSPSLGPGSCLDYTSILIHLFLYYQFRFKRYNFREKSIEKLYEDNKEPLQQDKSYHNSIYGDLLIAMCTLRVKVLSTPT